MVNVAAPVTAKSPAFVMELAVTSNVPDTVEAPRAISSVSTMVTLLPVVITNVLKSLLLFRVMLLLLPAANVAVLLLPSTEMFPESVIAPEAVTERSPVIVNAFTSNAELSTIVISAIVPELAVNVTVDAKSFPELFKLID